MDKNAKITLDPRDMFILGLDAGWKNHPPESALDEAAKREAISIVSRRSDSPLPIRNYPFVPAINTEALRYFMDKLDENLAKEGISVPLNARGI